LRLIRKKSLTLKRYGYIYDKVCAIENIKLAILKASLGKRKQKRVKKILDHIDSYAASIQFLLKTKSYEPSSYDIKVIQDGANKKERTIYKPRFFPDQIIHWALMLQLEPIIMSGMYEYSCGSIPGRGTSFGQKAIRNWLDKDKKNTKYCLKMDVSKFYPSVDNEILKQSFRTKIKDNDCLWLIDTIIDSNQGLPIGNYTSQWFSNFFLTGLDHFIFLGLRFFRNKTILRKRNALRIMRRVRKIKKKSYLNYSDACAIISYWGWIKRSNSFYFYNKHVKPYVSVGVARRAVSNYARIRNVERRNACKK
jgi:RNA-directed DNA polymerase